jgi:hypothetical protein
MLWLVRQAGKSQALLHGAVSELLTRRHAFVLYVAAAEHQAGAVYERKLRRPLTSLLTRLGMLDAVQFTKRGVQVPALGSALEIVPTNEATGTGRTPTLLILDEAREIPDEIYTAYAPSVIGAGGKIALASTAGRPKGFYYELVQQALALPSPETWLYRSAENENPHADQRMLGFLKKQFGVLFPAAARRELQNEFTEAGDELIPWAMVEPCIDDRLGELPSSGSPAFAFYDLSRVRDLTTRWVVLRGPARRPEATDHLIAASVRVWDPKRSPTGETPFEAVREDLLTLPRRFPNVQRVLVDAGAEASSLLSWAKMQPTLALRVEPFVASVNSNMDLWGSLVARLTAATISIPRHERLLAELRGLRREEFAFGSKWRVVDASRKFHRDVSLSLAGAVYAAATVAPPPSPSVAAILPTASGAAPAWQDQYFK